MILKRTGPNFMALLTSSTESALMEAGNSVLTASVFLGLVANLGFYKRNQNLLMFFFSNEE